MALALYRTYRPGTLAEVIGQEHVTEPLARALDSGRTHHAYLLSGPRGCGKTSTARILARSLNCAEGTSSTPCGHCQSCLDLAPNGPGSIDVVEMDAATHRGIDDARDLREKAIFAPAVGQYRVYIIDEAHQLTKEAANALLKLIEEPPPHLRFIFATTEPDKILPTIRSRTFHYGFRLIPAGVLAEHLAVVCRAEGVRAEPGALAVVARAGAGSVRDSLSVLGQLLAGAGSDGLTYAEAVRTLGLTDDSLIEAFVTALSQGSAAQMFHVVDQVIGAGYDPRRFATDVLDRLRDLILVRADGEVLSTGVIDVPDDAGQRLLSQAASLGPAELSRAADLVSAGLSELKGATAPRLQLELLCARLALAPVQADPGAMAARIERLERLAASGPTAPAGRGSAAHPVPGSGAQVQAEAGHDLDATGSEPPERAPTPDVPESAPGKASPPRRPTLRTAEAASDSAVASQPAVPAGQEPPLAPATGAVAAGASAPTPPGRSQAAGAGGGEGSDPATAASWERVREGWPGVLEALFTASRVAWAAFSGARPVSLHGGALAVAVPDGGAARAITQRGHDERLRQVLIDVLGLDVAVDVMHEDRNPSLPVGHRPQASRQARPAAPARSRVSAPPAAQSAVRSGVIESAAQSGPEGTDPPDEPSDDDPDLVGADSLALIERELGARAIGEIKHA